jgi:hypothetical protein
MGAQGARVPGVRVPGVPKLMAPRHLGTPAVTNAAAREPSNVGTAKR